MSAKPSPATNLTVVQDPKILAADLRWSLGQRVTSQRVQRAVGTGAFISIATLSSSQTSYQDSAVLAGTLYTYRLVEVNSHGNATSAAVTITLVTAPTIPTPSTTPPDGTQVTPPDGVLVDASGATWSFGGAVPQWPSPNVQILRNGVDSGGIGSIMVWCGGQVYVFGADTVWYQAAFTGTAVTWMRLTADDPCLTPSPTPPSPSGTYGLSVVNGGGSGSYPAGAVVPLVTNPTAFGEVFSGWKGASVHDPTAPITTLTMPASETTVTASYTLPSKPSSSTVLQPTDISYLGCALIPLESVGSTSNFGLGTGALTGRTVDGVTRLTLCGSIPNGGPLYEVTLPSALAPDYATAQIDRGAYQCIVVNDWGLPTDLATKMFGAVSVNGYYTRGLLHYNGKLLIAFQDKYAGADFPCIISTHPQADGQPLGPASGPWFTAAGSKSTGGYLAALPPTFASAYTNGHPIAYGSPFGSVGAASPWGIICTPGAEPSDDQPLTTPIACGPPLADFSMDIPQPVPTWVRRAICGYNIAGVGATCAQGSYGPNPSDGHFGPCDYPISGDTLGNARRNQNVVNDYVFGSVWYTGTAKQGVLFFGWLVTDVPGAAASGRYGTDDKPHAWYHANNTDCHSQTDAWYTGITGPHTPSKRLVLWIYDQDDFAKVAQGQMAATDLRENTLTPLSPLSGGTILEEPVVGPTGVQTLTNGYIDANNRLYVAENFRDTATNAYSPRSVIHVFQLPV